MGALLLLSLLLSSPVDGVTGTLSSVSATQNGNGNENVLIPNEQGRLVEGIPRFKVQLNPDTATSDNICYKIRTYVFELNDDRAPKFLRETTCGPATAKSRNVEGQQAPKLLPAIR